MLKSTLTFSLLFAISLNAQQLPEVPHHKFADKTNLFLFSSMALTYTTDALTTQRANAYGGHEDNPLYRPFVNSRKGTAFAFGASYAGTLGLMYWMHRRNHHRIERIIGFANLGNEAFCTIRNRVLFNSLHPQQPMPPPPPDTYIAR